MGSGTPLPPSAIAAPDVAGCSTRQYTFNRNGARTNLKTFNGTAGTPCPATTGTAAVARTWTLDGADRTTGTAEPAPNWSATHP